MKNRIIQILNSKGYKLPANVTDTVLETAIQHYKASQETERLKREIKGATKVKAGAIEKACHFAVKPKTEPRRKYDRKEEMRKAMLKYIIPALLLCVINTNSDAFLYVKFERGQTCCVYPQTSCDTIQTSGVLLLTSCVSHLTSCVSHQTSGALHLTSGVLHLTSGVQHQTSGVLHQTSGVSHQTSCVLHLTSCALHQTSCVLHLTSCALHLTSCALHQTSGALHQTKCVLHPTSGVLHLTSCVLHQTSIVSHQVKPNLQKEEYYLIMNSLTKLPFGKIKEYCVINTKQSQRFKLPLPEVQPPPPNPPEKTGPALLEKKEGEIRQKNIVVQTKYDIYSHLSPPFRGERQGVWSNKN